MYSNKKCSKVFRFRKGQAVSVNGMTGVAVGWKRGKRGLMVAVEITALKGRLEKGTVVFRYPGGVTVRKGRAGDGMLPRYA
jgi:uncharacterized membrane protein YczE